MKMLSSEGHVLSISFTCQKISLPCSCFFLFSFAFLGSWFSSLVGIMVTLHDEKGDQMERMADIISTSADLIYACMLANRGCASSSYSSRFIKDSSRFIKDSTRFVKIHQRFIKIYHFPNYFISLILYFLYPSLSH
ncbi:unnamed protein product [Lupinus luteus]|uniref:Uncharacterized protein n=1 Tax=Lupinus luteus TaxID=3873 RepID=A0AAV1Y6L6_LUPLU